MQLCRSLLRHLVLLLLLTIPGRLFGNIGGFTTTGGNYSFDVVYHYEYEAQANFAQMIATTSGGVAIYSAATGQLIARPVPSGANYAYGRVPNASGPRTGNITINLPAGSYFVTYTDVTSTVTNNSPTAQASYRTIFDEADPFTPPPPPPNPVPATPNIGVRVVRDTAVEGQPLSSSNSGKVSFFRYGARVDYSQPLTFNWFTDGSATDGIDYVNNQGSPLTIPAGQVGINVKVEALADGNWDPAETIVYHVAGGGGYNADGSTATVTIIDPGSPPVPNGAPRVRWDGLAGFGQSVDRTIGVGQSITLPAHAEDDDGNLTDLWIDRIGVGLVANSNGGNAPARDAAYVFSSGTPGDFTFRAHGRDATGADSGDIIFTVHVTNRPPTVYWTAPGLQPLGADPNYKTISIFIGQSVTPTVHAHDDDSNLAALFVDKANNVPPANDASAWAYNPVSGADGDGGGNTFTPTTPGDFWFSARALDQAGAYSDHIHILVHVINRPPTISWAVPGLQPYGGDPNYRTLTVEVGQTLDVRANAHDDDGNLAAIWIDSANDVPPVAGAAFAWVPVGGADGTAGNNWRAPSPGDYWFSARAGDSAGAYSDHIHILIHVNSPPIVAWEGLGNWGQNVDRTIYVGQSLTVSAIYADADNGFGYTWASSTATPGAFAGADGPQPAGTTFVRRNWNGGGTFAPDRPGEYFFYATASDNRIQTPTIVLHVSVPNRPPTVAWTVAGAVQVNGNTWVVDRQGTDQAPMISAVGADPDNRPGAVLINRGVVDPSAGQGTPFAQTPGTTAGNPMTADEMLPPLFATMPGGEAGFDGNNQYNYSWFSAVATDQDGAKTSPIYLLARVANRAPSTAVWTAPTGTMAVPGDATSVRMTTFVNTPPRALTTLSSDPEGKHYASIINRGYQTPAAGNADGSEVGVGYSANGGPATATTTPGAELWDAPGTHWYSAIAIDRGNRYSPAATHLDVEVVNRQPTARFAAVPANNFVNGSVSLQGVGDDPDLAMRRVRVEVVSAPVNSGMTPGQVLADTTAPAAQLAYPSNLPTMTTTATVVPTYSGIYRLRTISFDRHGGQAQADADVTVQNRAPVFNWTQAEVRVLAGQTAVLPFQLSDPDGNLGFAVATGPGGYSSQVNASNPSNGSGTFAFPTTVAGTFTVVGRGYDRENLASVNSPSIQVVVEPVNAAPTTVFTAPPPGGTDNLVMRFVDDVVPVAAHAADVDTNLVSLDLTLAGQPWASVPAGAGDVASLDATGSFTVPALGAEVSHDHLFLATARDRGRVAGGQISQPPLVSTPPSRLIVRVPNRAPLVQWIVPTGGIGLTPATPFVGYLLQPLRVSAQGTDRDRNLASVTASQQGGSGVVKQGTSDDGGRTAVASIDFTPTVPGTYVFLAQARDQAGADSGAPVPLYVVVRDYPGESTGTLGALIISDASRKEEVFRDEGLPVIIKGGVAAIGRRPIATAGRRGPTQIRPVPSWLNGSQIPPLVPPILDLRTQRVEPLVEHEATTTTTTSGTSAVEGEQR